MVDGDNHQLIAMRRVTRTKLTSTLLHLADQQQNMMTAAARYLGNGTEDVMSRVGR